MQRVLRILRRWSASILDFLVTQWCLMLISWPIMLAWGLPVATLSPIGNFVFGPFLSVFLILATLLTISVFCCLPLWPWTIGLEYLTSSWMYVMSHAPKHWYLTLPRPSLILLLATPIGTIMIMHFKPLNTAFKRFVALLLFSGVLTLLFSQTKAPDHLDIAFGNRTVSVTKQSDGTLLAHDPGFIRRKSSTNSWINYTFLPSLALTFGAEGVETYQIDRCTPSIAHFLSFLCEKELIKILVIGRVCADAETMKALQLCAAEHRVKIMMLNKESE